MKQTLGIERGIFTLLLLLHLVMIWSLPVFLTQDGPSHLYNARLLSDLLTGADGAVAHYHNINSDLVPNAFTGFVLATLMQAMPALSAEKLMISFLLLSFTLSFRLWLKKINPSGLFLSSIGFLLFNSYFLYYGFYNFLWALSFFFLLLAHLQNNKLKWTGILLQSTLLLLIYFAHPVVLVLSFLWIGIDLLLLIRTIKPAKLFLRLLPVLPAALFLLLFLTSHPPSGRSLFGSYMEYIYFRYLFLLDHLIAFAPLEKYLYWLLSLLIGAVLILAFRKIRLRDISGFMLKAGVFVFVSLLIYFFVNPKLSGGSYLDQRMRYIIYFVVLASIANRADVLKAFHKSVILLSTALLTISVLGLRYPIQKKLSVHAESLIETTVQLPEDAVFLALSYSNKGEINGDTLSPFLAVFKHAGNLVALESTRTNLRNYETSSGLFPVIWSNTTSANNAKKLNNGLSFDDGDWKKISLEQNPPDIEIIDTLASQIPYIVLWGDCNHNKQASHQQGFEESLHEHYMLLYQSEDQLTRIYEKRHQNAESFR